MHSAFLDILVASIEGLKLIISVNNAMIYAVSCKYYSYSFCFVFFLSCLLLLLFFYLCYVSIDQLKQSLIQYLYIKSQN